MRTKGKNESEHVLIIQFKVETSRGLITCGMNVHKVKEVIEAEKLTNLPNEYAPFTSVIDLRGNPIPVIPLDLIFKAQNSNLASKSRRILIIELQNQCIGLMVSSTQGIRSFKNSDVLETPQALQGAKTHFFNGMLRDGQNYTYLLDIESILDSLGYSLDRTVTKPINSLVFKGKKILVVEDSKLYQKKIKNVFSEWGCNVTIASNGKEALELLAAKSYEFDLVFSDIEMPIMNGIEFATHFKSLPQANGIPLVFNSSLSNPMLIDDIKSKGLGHYIVKFDSEAIESQLAQIFQSDSQRDSLKLVS